MGWILDLSTTVFVVFQSLELPELAKYSLPSRGYLDNPSTSLVLYVSNTEYPGRELQAPICRGSIIQSGMTCEPGVLSGEGNPLQVLPRPFLATKIPAMISVEGLLASVMHCKQT